MRAACQISSTLKASVYRMPRRFFPARRDRAGTYGWPVRRSLIVAQQEPAGPDPRNAFRLSHWAIVRPGRSTCCRERRSARSTSSMPSPLFTFHQPRLMRREENPGRSDNDQIIQAVTLALPDGTVQALRSGGCMTAPGICGTWAGASFWSASEIVTRSPTHR